MNIGGICMDKILTLHELTALLDKYSHKELHVHHTWKPTHRGFTGSNHLALQAGMRRTHVEANGWSDIGQHVTLMPDGTFVTGRDFGTAPASIKGFNTGAFACETLGNFDIEGIAGSAVNDQGYDKLDGEQREALVGLASYFDKKERYVRFHRENAPKTCPGNGVDKNEFMAEVKNYGVIKEIEKVVDNMGIKDLQVLCNKLGITDYEGKALVVDGSCGKRTESARIKLKQLLTIVLK